ncbi:Uncharacterised protein [Mycobacterium tuberculosis]|nr:Uncharacterised protein [Mycobacterium tuberculosis]
MGAGTFMKNTVPTKVRRIPRYRYCVPMVTISEGALSQCTSSPLSTPSTAPLTAPAINSSAMGASGK